MRSTALFFAAALVALPVSQALSKKPPRPSPAPAVPPPAPEVAPVNPWQLYAACLTDKQRYQAEIAWLQVLCQGQADQARACIARVRDRQNSSTGRGALIGLGAAIVTGGASLLYTGAGALIGHATGDQADGECGQVPTCDPSSLDARAQAAGVRDRTCLLPSTQAPEQAK